MKNKLLSYMYWHNPIFPALYWMGCRPLPVDQLHKRESAAWKLAGKLITGTKYWSYREFRLEEDQKQGLYKELEESSCQLVGRAFTVALHSECRTGEQKDAFKIVADLMVKRLENHEISFIFSVGGLDLRDPAQQLSMFGEMTP